MQWEDVTVWAGSTSTDERFPVRQGGDARRGDGGGAVSLPASRAERPGRQQATASSTEDPSHLGGEVGAHAVTWAGIP